MIEVRSCMENPSDDVGLSKLLGIISIFVGLFFHLTFCIVHLDVDAKSADSWYKAK